MNDLDFEQFHVGMKQSFTTRVTAEKIDLFLKLSGDQNPIHWDDDFAIKKGFKKRVAYGMLTASFYSTLVGVYLPGLNSLLHAVSISFNSAVYDGDTLKVEGEITYISEALKEVEIRATISNQEDIVVSRAKLKVGVT